MKRFIIFFYFSLLSSSIYAQNGCSIVEAAMYTEDFISKYNDENGKELFYKEPYNSEDLNNPMFDPNMYFEYNNPIYFDNENMFILVFRVTVKSSEIKQGAMIWTRNDSCKIVKEPDSLPFWKDYSSEIPASIESQKGCSFYDAAMYTKDYVSKIKDENGKLMFDENMSYIYNNPVYLDKGDMFILIFTATDIYGTLRQGAVIWTYKEGCKIVKKPDYLPILKSYPSELNKD